MQQRELNLETYDEAIAELDRLAAGPREQAGKWDLGQTCKHLSYYMHGSLDGFDFMLPWAIRKLVGRPLLKKLLKRGEMPTDNRTVPASVFESDVDQPAAIAEARELLERLQITTEGLHPSPLFDELTSEQWQTLHCLHASHHFGFLVPTSEMGGA